MAVSPPTAPKQPPTQTGHARIHYGGGGFIVPLVVGLGIVWALLFAWIGGVTPDKPPVTPPAVSAPYVPSAADTLPFERGFGEQFRYDDGSTVTVSYPTMTNPDLGRPEAWGISTFTDNVATFDVTVTAGAQPVNVGVGSVDAAVLIDAETEPKSAERLAPAVTGLSDPAKLPDLQPGQSATYRVAFVVEKKESQFEVVINPDRNPARPAATFVQGGMSQAAAEQEARNAANREG